MKTLPLFTLSDTTHDGMLNINIHTGWRNFSNSLFYFTGATNLVFFLIFVLAGPGVFMGAEIVAASQDFQWGISKTLRYTMILLGGVTLGVLLPAYLIPAFKSNPLARDWVQMGFLFLSGLGMLAAGMAIPLALSDDDGSFILNVLEYMAFSSGAAATYHGGLLIFTVSVAMIPVLKHKHP